MSLAWAAAAAVVLTMSAAMVLAWQWRVQRTAGELRARLSAATIAYLPGTPRPAPAHRTMQVAAHVMVRRAEAAMGYRRVRQPHYRHALRVVAMGGALVGVAGGWLCARVAGPAGWLAAPALGLIGIRLYYRQAETRLAARLYTQFPDALAMIVRAVRVGVPVGEAVRLVASESQAPTTVEFRQLSDEVGIGVKLEDALRQMGDRNRLAEYRFFATALALQSQTGGGLTETLETLADTIRKRVAARARGHALASEARTSCYVLAVLPLLVGGALFATNPGYMMVLFDTGAGNRLLATGVGLLATGLFSMRAIIRKSLG